MPINNYLTFDEIKLADEIIANKHFIPNLILEIDPTLRRLYSEQCFDVSAFIYYLINHGYRYELSYDTFNNVNLHTARIYYYFQPFKEDGLSKWYSATSIAKSCFRHDSLITSLHIAFIHCLKKKLVLQNGSKNN